MKDKKFRSNDVFHEVGDDFGSGFFKDFRKGFAVTLRVAFRPPITLMYPFEADVLAPRFRGAQGLYVDKCIACGICARACPNGSIKITTSKNEAGKKQLDEFEIDLGRCIFCALCVDSCPKKALKMTSLYDYCCNTRNGLILNKKRLARNCKYIVDENK